MLRFFYIPLVCVPLTIAIDFVFWLRSRLYRSLFAMLSILLIGALAIVMSAALISLRNISTTIKFLEVDALVGVDSSSTMKTIVRDSRLQALRYELSRHDPITEGEVDKWADGFHAQLEIYRSGVFVKEDAENADRVSVSSTRYIELLRAMAKATSPDRQRFEEIDRSADQVAADLNGAYEFNRRRTKLKADEALDAASDALRTSDRLWVAVGVLFLLSIGVVFVYRSLNLTDQ